MSWWVSQDGAMWWYDGSHDSGGLMGLMAAGRQYVKKMKREGGRQAIRENGESEKLI
jgi:hypothetical protein